MACCNKRVNQNHMKILSIMLALFATSFAVHAQTYTKAELTQAAYNIQQGHNEGAKICLTYKAQVEASKAWTEEIRQNYLFAIQSLLEYYSMQKRYTDEEELLNHAIALYNTRDSITNNPQTRALHTMQTRVQFDKKNYDALIGYAKKALNMYNAVGDHGIDYCILCCNTSLAYVEQDDEQHATQYIDEAFNCQQKLSAQFNLSKYMGYYPIQNQRGYVYLIFGMYEKAIECFKDIVDNASPDTLASVYYLAANNLSTCYFIMNQLDKAIPLLETVKKATPTLAYTVSQNLSVDYALTGNDKKALENLRQFNAEGYEQALAIISKFSEIDREAMLKKLSQEMSDCNNFVVRYVPQAAVEAFDINLLMRSASLSVNRMVKDFANKSSKCNELAHLRQMLAKGHISTAQYDSIHHAIIDIEQNLLRADNQFELTLKAQTATYESTKQMLKADEAYVLYCNLPTFDVEDGELAKTLHYAAYIVRSQQNDGPTMVDLGLLEDIDSLFFTATPTAEYAAETYAAGNAQLLYDKLWAPLMPHLRGAKRIYYSTTGNLATLNFDALMQHNNKRLGDVTELTLLSSPLKIKSATNVTPIKNVVAMGCPDYDMTPQQMVKATSPHHVIQHEDISSKLAMRGDDTRGNWHTIPATRNEVANIAAIVRAHGAKVCTFTDAQATEEAFKALDGHAPDALHFATHGFAISTMQQYDNSPFAQSRTAFTPNGNYMMWSGLVLAGGNNAWQCKPLPKGVEDGILTADEISRLDLSHTRLVVLSACETARGHIDNTDGVWGLQRAFKQAGAGTIVMTLWKVSDETTCMFMTEFYRQLANGLNTRQALKRARTYLIEQGATDPYYWAAFVAID